MYYIKSAAVVQGTYNLGPLALQCYEIISSVTAAVEMAHYRSCYIISDYDEQQQLKNYASSCVKPVLDYYIEYLNAEKLTEKLSVLLQHTYMCYLDVPTFSTSTHVLS